MGRLALAALAQRATQSAMGESATITTGADSVTVRAVYSSASAAEGAGGAHFIDAAYHRLRGRMVQDVGILYGFAGDLAHDGDEVLVKPTRNRAARGPDSKSGDPTVAARGGRAGLR